MDSTELTGNPKEQTMTIDLFRVQADPTTGEWIGEPEHIGQIDRAEHDSRSDTDAMHFDTFEREGVTCAVEVEWAAGDLWMIEQDGEPIPDGQFKTEREADEAMASLTADGWGRLSVARYTGEKAAAYR